MSRGCFIAGTDTGVGKTRVTVGLLQALRRRGCDACGMKPVATGLRPIADEEKAPIGDDRCLISDDVVAIAAVSALPPGELRACINPYAFEPPISPHLAAARERRAIDPFLVAAAHARLAAACDVVVVEGTGGWLAPIGPIGDHATMADIARKLALPVILVVGLRLGCLNHALLSAAAIRHAGLTLAGWVGSVLEPDMLALEDNIATLEARLDAPRLGLLAFDRDRHADAQRLDAAAAWLLRA